MTTFRPLYIPFAVLFLICGLVFVSCKKEPGTDPKPEKNPITGIPALSSVPGNSVNFDAGTATYAVTVPAGTDIKALKLSIPLAAGASISPDPNTARDYINPVTYTVTAADGKKYQVIVKVAVSASAKSSAKQITSFRFAALNVDAEIDEANRKITAKISFTEDITKLVPTITVSDKASVSPASGVQQNFTNAVNYTVTAEDGSTQIYEVKVEKQNIGGGRACLLTRSEYTSISNGKQVTDIIDYGYDAEGRIVSIKSYELGNIENSRTVKISYDVNGDVAESQNTAYEITHQTTRFTYQNRRVVKMEVFGINNSFGGDYIALGVVKFNDNNEFIEYNEFNNSQDEFPRYILKLEYQNHNITKHEFYDDDSKKWNKTEFDYDNKHSPSFASNPHPVLKAIYFYGLPAELYGRNNIVSGRRDDGETVSLSYKYNNNNYPVEMKGTEISGDAFSTKYYYSNCD